MLSKKKQNIQHINPFFGGGGLFCQLRNYRATGSKKKKKWSKAVNLCWNTQQMLEESITAGMQLLVYLSEYFTCLIFGLPLIRYTFYIPPNFRVVWKTSPLLFKKQKEVNMYMVKMRKEISVECLNDLLDNIKN